MNSCRYKDDTEDISVVGNCILRTIHNISANSVGVAIPTGPRTQSLAGPGSYDQEVTMAEAGKGI